MTTAETTTETMIDPGQASTPAAAAVGLARLSAWRKVAAAIALLALFTAGLLVIQFATANLVGVDGYYHARIADLMRTQGLRPPFPYLPLSILNPQEFYDHHFLFHVALIPFVAFDVRLGAKIAGALFAALAFLAIWRLLDRQRVPYAALWALGLLAVSDAFLFRMSMVRAQSLSLALLALGLLCMFERRYAWLAPLGFLYVWLYDAFPLLGILAGIYTLAVLLAERRLELRPIFYAALGILIGLLINPYFPQDITFAARHILPKITETTAVSVGNEWFPYTTRQLMENSPLALAAFASGILALGLRERRMDVATATAFLTALFFGVLLLQSRRFVEYFPPFALIFAALAWAPLLRQDQPAAPGASRLERLRRWLPALLLLAAAVGGAFYSIPRTQAAVRDARPLDFFAGASAWLVENTPPGSLVFQTDWDDFPRLFYHNTHNTYLIGLDPTYMQLYDAALYDLWVDITQGKVENPSGEIASRFGARYVVSDLSHDEFIRRAQADPNLQEAYRDHQAVVYTVAAP